MVDHYVSLQLDISEVVQLKWLTVITQGILMIMPDPLIVSQW